MAGDAPPVPALVRTDRVLPRESWRLKKRIARLIAAPVVAGAVFFAGADGVTRYQYLNPSDGASEFDDLRDDVPVSPGVNGRLGTEQPSRVPVIVTGTIDGRPTVPIGVNGAVEGIPSSVLPAYQAAALALAQSYPNCGLTWPLLAGIGKVESSHASGGRVDARGTTRGRILGPVLNGGPGMASIRDTDGGRLDGDRVWDRAVGPMQFIPGTWAAFQADGNSDGIRDPHNVYDAAKASGQYLCAGGANLHDPRGLVEAVLRYNHSMEYVAIVLRWMRTYAQSAVTIPDRTGIVPPATDTGNVERADDPTDLPTTETSDIALDRPVQTIRPITRPQAPATTQPTRAPTRAPIQPPTTTQPTKPPTQVPGTTTPTKPPTTTPTQNPSENPTQTPTPTPTPTETQTPTPTPSDTPTPTPTDTPTPCPTTTPTETPTPTPTPTPGPCPTPTPGGGDESPDPSPQPTGGSETPTGDQQPSGSAPLAVQPTARRPRRPTTPGTRR